MKTTWKILILAWSLTRVAALPALFSPGFVETLPGDARWIGVLGGGGGARLLEAATLAKARDGVDLVVAGTAPELEFARSVLAPRGLGFRALEVRDPSTRGCVDALIHATTGSGVLVTDRAHAPRTLMTWRLRSLRASPKVLGVRAGVGRDLMEWAKCAWYLLRH